MAEEREANLRDENALFDDDGIVERIFNSLTGTKMDWVFPVHCKGVHKMNIQWRM